MCVTSGSCFLSLILHNAMTAGNLTDDGDFVSKKCVI